ncbi:MAG: MFS transporter [Desulfobacteraceae bacterium]|nr:MFS transporter [Desulfobacteraceae bacterium]
MAKILNPDPSVGESPRLFYGYVVVGVAFCMQGVFWGTYQTFGVFFNSLLDEFSWSRATISSAASLGWLLLGFISIITGAVSDRFGPRLAMSSCGLIFGLGYFLMSSLTNIWQFFLFYGLIVAVGMSGVDVVPLSTVARWFAKKRGMMTGITKIGTGVGMMVTPLVASNLILSYGWRTAYFIIATITLLVIISLAQLLRRDPEEMGQSKTQGSVAAEDGLTLKEAIRKKQFILLCAAYLCIVFCVHTIMVHIVPHGIAVGVSGTEAASVFSAIGGVSIVARFVMGVVGDRIGNRLALAICFFPLIVALIWLQMARELWMLLSFAAVYGFSHGGFFAVIPPLIAELFGTKAHGGLFGIVFSSGAVGGAIGPLMAGRIFDLTDSYQMAFFILTSIGILGLLFTLWIRPTSIKKNR